MNTDESDYRGQVLVVDDDPEVLGVFERQLSLNFDVFTAVDAEEGLVILAARPIDVVVADQRMPAVTGIEFLVEVRKRYPDKARILLCDHSDMQVLTEAVNQGHIFGYLSKPWQGTQIFGMLRQGVEMARLRVENHALIEQLKQADECLEQQYRLLTEQRLRESEARYRDLFEGSVNGILIDDAMRPVYANQAFLELVELDSLDELLAFLSVRPFIAKHELPRLESIMAQRLGTGDAPISYEFEARTVKGRPLKLINTVRLIEWDGRRMMQNTLLDVTAQRQAEDALQQERGKAQNYLDIAGVMLVVIGADHCIQLVNRRASEILEYPQSDLMGRNWFALCIPERIREPVEEVFAQLLDGQVAPLEYFENPVVTRGGKERIIAWHNTLLTDDDGRILGTLSSGEDVTELKCSEARLRFQAQLLDNVRESVRAMDLEGRVVYWGKGAEALYGYTAEEVLGRPHSFIDDPLAQMEGQECTRFIQENGTWSGDYLQRRKDGAEFWAETHIALVNDENGEPAGLIAIDRDISERKRAADALRENEEQVRLLLEFTGDGIYTIDIEGRCTLCNPAAARMLGYADAGELLGIEMHAQIHHSREDGTPYPVAECPIHNSLKNRPYSGENEWFWRADGSCFMVQFTAYPIHKEGHTVGAVVSFQNITELKLAKEALEQEAQANRTLADLSRTLLSSLPIEELSQRVLEYGQQLTASRLGYVGYIDPDTGALVVPTMVRGVWEQCRGDNKNIIFEQFGGLWGWVLDNKRPLICNEPADDPRSAGTPAGHLPIENFLSAPALAGERLVGQVAFANSTRDYTARDLQIAERLSDSYALALERNRGEQALRLAKEEAESSSRFLRAILDETPNLIVLKDKNSVYRVANRMFCELLGKSEEEIVGKTDFELFPKEEAEIYHRDDVRVMSSGHAQARDEVVSGHEGKRWLHVSKTPFRGSTPEIDGVLIVVRDITARKQAELYRQLNEHRLDLLLQLNREAHTLDERALCARALDIAVDVTDSRVGYLHMFDEDQENINLVSWNQAALESCSAAYDSHYPLSAAGIWADCVRRRSPVIHNDYPHMPERKGLPAGHFPVRRHMSVPLIEDGQVGMIIGVGNKESPYDDNDVRQVEMIADEVQKCVVRLRAEEALVAAKEEAEQARRQADFANQAKSAFLANMSHELRTPLNGILGYAQILSNDLQLDEAVRDKIQVIRHSGEYLLTLINDILDLSKIEAGKLELQPHQLHLRGFFDEVAHLFRMRAEQKDLVFHFECVQGSPEGKELPAVVDADEKRLRQVLLNLLSNAMKFTDQGQVTLSVTYFGSALRVEVADSGRGIAAEDLATIFKPFRQVGDQRHHQGTGLGLSICRKLVRMMGGELEVASTPGEGSRFWFEIPLQVVERGEAPVARALASHSVVGYQGAPQTVLVVDDVAINRKVLVDFLAPLGFILSEAEDGGEALRTAAGIHPSMVFMDLRMPGMDGFEAVRRLRELPEFAATPIFAVSAGVFEEDRQRALTAGCTAFLWKPLAFDVLFTVLAEYCGIEWTTTETKLENSDAELIPPPLGILEELQELASYGDIRQLRITLESLIQNNPAEYAPYYRKALKLAEAIELKQLNALLKVGE